jgi:hypothetical protein
MFKGLYRVTSDLFGESKGRAARAATVPVPVNPRLGLLDIPDAAYHRHV